jgi:NhaP-type Na+/H+ or K+/H+ antiporter
MTQRIACAMAFLAFAVCLVAGGIEANNSFATTVGRAVVAMLATLVIGLIVGAMARKMLDENLHAEAEKLKKSSSPPPSDGR